MLSFIQRNPTALVPVFLVLIVLSLGIWKLQRDLELIGLTMVPTSRLESLEQDNAELRGRVKTLEERLELLVWLSRDCPEIRRTMDEHGH